MNSPEKQEQLRLIAAAVIRRTLTEARTAQAPARQLIERAYPFGVREGPVYELWLEEVERAAGPAA